MKASSVPSSIRSRSADADDRAAIDCAQRFAELRREQEARDEHARRELIEAARLERLLAEVTAWRRSEEIRAYVSALEERLPTLESDEEVRIGEWCRWASDRRAAGIWPTRRRLGPSRAGRRARTGGSDDADARPPAKPAPAAAMQRSREAWASGFRVGLIDRRMSPSEAILLLLNGCNSWYPFGTRF